MSSRLGDLEYIKEVIQQGKLISLNVPWTGGRTVEIPLSNKMKQRFLSVLGQQIIEEKLRREGAQQVKDQVNLL